MKKLLLTLLTIVSTTAFSQYTHNDGSFQKTYTQIRNHQNIDGEWTYTGGDFVEWTFHLNVDFFPCPDCPEMRGTVMEDINGEPQFFMNYLGDIIESSDDYGEYGSFKVDILSKNDKTGKWEWWDAGECRYYGNYVMLYLNNPATVRFDYFNVK